MDSDQLLGWRPEVEEQRQDRQDGIKFWAAQKPDLHPGTVERLQAEEAPGSGAPAPPPPHGPALPHLGTKQVEMGSSHWLETLERQWGSGVS